MGFALSSMQLRSPAFAEGGAIPSKHTGEGADVSPELHWSDAPAGTKAFAVVCHDPDAPLVTPGHYGYVHWVLYNIPGTQTRLAEGTDLHTQGQSDFGSRATAGPCRRRGTASTATTSGCWPWTPSLASKRGLGCGNCWSESNRTWSA